MQLYIIGAYAGEQRHCMSLVLMPPYPSGDEGIKAFRTLCENVGTTYAFSTRIVMAEAVRATFEQLHRELGTDLRLACAAIFRAGFLESYQEAILDGMRKDKAIPMSFRNLLNEPMPVALATLLHICGAGARRELQS